MQDYELQTMTYRNYGGFTAKVSSETTENAELSRSRHSGGGNGRDRKHANQKQHSSNFTSIYLYFTSIYLYYGEIYLVENSPS